MNILSKLLEYRGIKDTSELDSEERLQFEGWKKILENDEVRISDIVEFCDTSLSNIEAQFGDIEADDKTKARLALQHTIYRSIKNMIQSPKAERESLVEYLTNLMK